ncbi:MAG: hypothetical protein SGJ20_11775 [Planctomycetota bacterium]|nr:hypothetical protein [Planctomycetota bacterium]
MPSRVATPANLNGRESEVLTFSALLTLLGRRSRQSDLRPDAARSVVPEAEATGQRVLDWKAAHRGNAVAYFPAVGRVEWARRCGTAEEGSKAGLTFRANAA